MHHYMPNDAFYLLLDLTSALPYIVNLEKCHKALILVLTAVQTQKAFCAELPYASTPKVVCL